MSDTHRIIKTPNPSVWSLAVTAKASILASQPDFTPVEGTAYKDFPKWLKDSSYIKKWGNYTYVGSEDGSNPGDVVLIFVKNFTAQENATPYRTTTYFGDHPWPPVLKVVVLLPAGNTATNGSINGTSALFIGKKYKARVVFIPDCREGTKFIEEDFFSNVPFDIPQYIVPVATGVSFDVPGTSANFPDSLHPEIIIPETEVVSYALISGTAFGASQTLKGQVFPKTNFTDWGQYVKSDQQTYNQGYPRKRITVIPPNPPKVIVKDI